MYSLEYLYKIMNAHLIIIDSMTFKLFFTLNRYQNIISRNNATKNSFIVFFCIKLPLAITYSATEEHNHHLSIFFGLIPLSRAFIFLVTIIAFYTVNFYIT